MVDAAERLVLQMSTDMRRLDRSVTEGQRRFDRRLMEMERRALQNDKKLSAIFAGTGRNLTASFQDGLRGLAPSLAAAFSVGAVIKYADGYTSLKNSLRAAGLEGARLTEVENGLYDAANRNGVAVAATAQLFQRAAFARDKLGASDAMLLQLVSGTTAALKLQGTSAEAASGPLLQLGQAISGNVVQAEEYNSLIDGLPVILQAAAEGSRRWGGDVSKLTADVKAGKVASKEFFDAILAGLPAIEARASKSQTTVSASLQTLNNELGRYVGQTDAGLSATERMAQGILLLADNLDVVVNAAGIAVVLIGSRYVGATAAAAISTARLTLFQTAMTASMTGTTRASMLAAASMTRLNASMAFFGGPIGIAIGLVAAGVVGLGVAMAEAEKDAERLNDATQTYNRLMREAGAVTDDAAAANMGIQASARSATGAIDAMCEATEDLANQTYRLADANKQAWRTDALRQIAANNEQIRRLEKVTPFDFLPTGPGGMPRIEGKANEAAELKRQNAALTAQTIGLFADGSTTFVTGGGSAGRGGAPTAPAGGGRSSGADPARQQSRRDELDLERQIAAARAKGDEAAVKALEERQRLAQLIASYEDAGFADARGKALEHLAYEAEAVALSERRELAEMALAAMAEGTAEAARALADGQERAANAALERLGLEVEIARLSGDSLLPAKERELWIAERVNELLRERPGLTADEAQGQAGGEYDSLRAADVIGGLGGMDPAGDRAAAMEELARLREQDLLSEEQAAQRKAQIDADYWSARAESARTGLDALAGLQNSSNKKLAAIGKAAAIAQATMDGVLAVQKALASAPPPMNFVNAAIVGAVAAANVAQIAGMADGGPVTGIGGPRQDNQIRALSVGEFVTNASATKKNRGVLEAINAGAVVRMADGGMVADMGRRVSAMASGVVTAGRREPGSSTYSPTIDARGADLGVVRRIERLLAEDRASFDTRARSAVARADKYALGGRKRR